MKAQDLRIGNLIYGDDEFLHMRCEAKVIRISEKEIQWESIKNENEGTVQYDVWVDVEPIPLSEEWLKRFGFKKTTEGYWSNGKLEVGYTTSDEFIQYEYLSVSKDQTTSTEMCDIKCVHELQNLFFALTGTELELQQPNP